MILPTDIAAALRELREGGASVPMSMPPLLYTDAAMLPVEIDAVFLSARVATSPDYEGTVWDFYHYMTHRLRTVDRVV